jgi:DNA-binding transcriptional LysR family regulator
MHLGTVEALKAAVRSRLGMSIVPDIAIAEQEDLIVRPLQPAVPSTLALIEHRNQTGGLALEIVRKALLELRDPAMATAEPKRTIHKPKRAPKKGRN